MVQWIEVLLRSAIICEGVSVALVVRTNLSYGSSRSGECCTGTVRTVVVFVLRVRAFEFECACAGVQRMQ